jgi:tight adherence protein C
MGCIACFVMGLRSRQASRVYVSSIQTTAPSHEMEQSLWERVIKPFLRQLHQSGRALTPKRSVEQIQQNLIMAGLPGGLTVTDFLGLRFFSGVVCGVTMLMIVNGRHAFSLMLAASMAAFLAGLYAPNLWLKGRVRRRQKQIALALPDALDMMSICVEAGLGFEAAMQKVATHSDGEFAMELRRVISEIRVGVRRTDALRNMVMRTGVPEVASFVAVLVQADKLGVTIRDVLNTQAEQMRMRRRQRAEEEARKAPLKMLFPLIVFIFPALFAVLLGPSVPRLIRIFGG